MLRQQSLQCIQQVEHIRRHAGLTHQPDADHLACELPKAPANLDAILVEELTAELYVIDAFWQIDDRKLVEPRRWGSRKYPKPTRS